MEHEGVMHPEDTRSRPFTMCIIGLIRRQWMCAVLSPATLRRRDMSTKKFRLHCVNTVLHYGVHTIHVGPTRGVWLEKCFTRIKSYKCSVVEMLSFMQNDSQFAQRQGDDDWNSASLQFTEKNMKFYSHIWAYWFIRDCTPPKKYSICRVFEKCRGSGSDYRTSRVLFHLRYFRLFGSAY